MRVAGDQPLQRGCICRLACIEAAFGVTAELRPSRLSQTLQKLCFLGVAGTRGKFVLARKCSLLQEIL